ncbi:MAG: geranylgeranyl reductase family protein [Ginsengibacter sp.]
MQELLFDVIIVGGGPSGAACAIKLSNTGLKVGLIEKSIFPRDKTCGDALSTDVINQLPMLSEKLAVSFNDIAEKVPSYGVKIFSPDMNFIDIPFIYKGKKSNGYICKRIHFDNFLFQFVKENTNVQVFEGYNVQEVIETETGVKIKTDKGDFESKIILGADGAHSVVSRNLSNLKVEKDHYSAGLRVYYENVSSFHEDNFIELYFFNELLPGYLWVFPLANNQANIGLGMLSSEVSKSKINLKETLNTLLTSHPALKERFANAKPIETVKGYGLPLGSKKREISGNRYLLSGDAASMIDPFSGEGIGNAIRCGRVAADHILNCFMANNYTASFNKAYDKEIYRRMWGELKVSRTLQRLLKYPWLYNLIVRKANKNKYLQQFLVEALASVDTKRKMFTRPWFYLRVLFG